MANTATGQPPIGVVQAPHITTNHTSKSLSFASILNPNAQPISLPNIPEPTKDFHHGEPSFVWEEKDVENMVLHEELQYAVVGKFAYGMPDFHEVRKQIPLQCDIKGQCCIGFLESRHVLIRLSLLEDYVHMLSRPAFYLKIGHTTHQLRGLKYDVWFDPREETSIGVAWISFPGLPPVFFVKEAVFALASAVGKPLQLDAATKAKTRPSCAKVKVEVDLLAHRPQRIRIGIKNSLSGETRFKWIRIKYEYFPMYCKECKLQGHNDDGCFYLHPELAPKDDIVQQPAQKDAPVKTLQRGKVVGDKVDNVKPMQGNNVEVVNTVQDRGNTEQVRVKQRNIVSKFTHPNRNPYAWMRVDGKKKQTKNDDMVEKVSISNTFAILKDGKETENVADTHDQQSQQVVQENQVSNVTTVNAVQKGRELTKGNDDAAGKKLNLDAPIETRKWAANVFKEHPKKQAVDEIVVSGKDAILSNEHQNDDAAGCIEHKEREEQPSTIDVEQLPSAIDVEPSAVDVEQLPSVIEVNQQLSRHGNEAVIVKAEGMPSTCDAFLPKVKDAAGCFIATAANGPKAKAVAAPCTSVKQTIISGIGPADPTKPNETKEYSHVLSYVSHMGSHSKEFYTPNDLFNGKSVGDAHGQQSERADGFDLVPIKGKLESESEVMPKLIPTIHLEQLCKNASLNCGKPYLNVNAPSFLPKSILQIVPHLKRLPSDNELIKQMDWHDTKGILARQVMFIHDEPRQTNYLVEDDDIFEDEELDEESTAYNFSIMAREGDLSPRPIRDKAIKKVMKERRPLEPARVQPSRSTKSKKYKAWKNSKK